MVTPAGQIGMSDVNIELGSPSTTQRALGDAVTRSLAGVPTGAISLNNLRSQRALISSGGTQTISGGYVTHNFTASGTFIITKNVKQVATTLEYIVVGGGGAGGKAVSRCAGGGGGGGVLVGTYPVAAGTLLPGTNVNVGAGGDGSLPASGNPSSIAWTPPLIPTHVYGWGGGAGGGTVTPTTGEAGTPGSSITPGGGSSGGGGKDGAGGGTGVAPGAAGGSGQNPQACPGPNFSGGGGGGAGGVAGGNATTTSAGPGGTGRVVPFTSPGTYGGGGGGSGQRGPGSTSFTAGSGHGPGGGGPGAVCDPASGPGVGTFATANSGGGGGGGCQLWPVPCVPPPLHGFGGNGGSGRVAIRYLGT